MIAQRFAAAAIADEISMRKHRLHVLAGIGQRRALRALIFKLLGFSKWQHDCTRITLVAC